MRRERAFLLVALLLPVIAVAVLEGAVRMLWRDGAVPLFVEAPFGGGAWLMANPAVAARWFPGEQRPPGTNQELMLRHKPTNGFRVFVLGESAAQGFPYPRIGAFSRALQLMLADALPGESVEVINLGIAATNSFAMWDLLPEVLDHQPDAVLYYGGHNEYYGALGAGSSVRLVGSPRLTRLYLRLQRLRFVRLGAVMVARLRDDSEAGEGSGDGAGDVSFMGTVARDRAILLDGTVYLDGLDIYEQNLTKIAHTLRDAGVPFYLAGVASNLRDQAPFASPLNGPADSAFDRGRQLLGVRDLPGARAAFRAARDLDVIRFRAPSTFPEIARRVATGEGAVYVPVDEAFASAAVDAIPGAELFLEHVHPRRNGSMVIARAFFDALSRVPPPGHTLRTEAVASDERYENARGLSEFDDRVAAHRVQTLLGRWPFVPVEAQRDHFGSYRPTDFMDSLAFAVARGALAWGPAKLTAARWHEGRNEMGAAVSEYLGLVADAPMYVEPRALAGEALLRAGRPAAADSMLASAMQLGPSRGAAMLRAQIASSERRWADAIQLLQVAVALTPSDPEALYRLSLTFALSGDTAMARTTAERLARVTPRGNIRYAEWLRLLAVRR